jgi:hypothetical protein
MSGVPPRCTTKWSADDVMIPSVSSSGVKFPPKVSRPPGGLSLTPASKRERSP